MATTRSGKNTYIVLTTKETNLSKSLSVWHIKPSHRHVLANESKLHHHLPISSSQTIKSHVVLENCQQHLVPVKRGVKIASNYVIECRIPTTRHVISCQWCVKTRGICFNLQEEFYFYPKFEISILLKRLEEGFFY